MIEDFSDHKLLRTEKQLQNMCAVVSNNLNVWVQILKILIHVKEAIENGKWYFGGEIDDSIMVEKLVNVINQLESQR